MVDRHEEIQKLWKELLEENPTNGDLRYIIRYVKSLREQAWTQLLSQNPTNGDLYYIIRYVKSLREQAEKALDVRDKPKETRKQKILERLTSLR